MTNGEQLRQLIDQHFNEEELRTLCFDLAVDYDSLEARGKAAKVRELLALYQRSHHLPELLEHLRRSRPNVEWGVSAKHTTRTPGPVSFPLSPTERRTRADVLAKVKANWIHSILDKSIHQVTRLELGFHYRPEAVGRSWSMVLQQKEEPDEEIPAHVSIFDVYQQYGHDLLILGEPGAGKTITLLELARDLINRAELDETQSMPVVLNLASWAVKRLPLADWLIEELYKEYQVSRKTARQWVETDYQLTLLLDGLDEVQKEQRDACAAAINAFRAEHLVHLVVCSRTEDYEQLSTKLNMATAVALQPLTTEQIDGYLAAGGDSLAAARQAVQDDVALQTLAQSPLLLSIIAITYRNRSLTDLQANVLPSERRRHLFDNYIDHMFARRNTPQATAEKAKRSLSWLAYQMRQRAQTIFVIENLQPSWLPSRRQRGLYALTCGLVVGGLNLLLIWSLVSFYSLLSGELDLKTGLVLGFGGGITTGLYYIWRSYREEIDVKITSNWKQWLRIIVLDFLQTGSSLSLAIGIGIGVEFLFLSLPLASNDEGLFFWGSYLLAVLIVVVFSGVLAGVLVGFILAIPVTGINVLLSAIVAHKQFGLSGSLGTITQHLLLRAYLRQAQNLPFKANVFWDNMVDYILLRKTGDGYLFVHQLLLDHFVLTGQGENHSKGELTSYDVRAIAQQGKKHYHTGDYEQALNCFDQAIELQPKDINNYHWRGRVYWDMKDFHHALADFTKVIELQPKNIYNYHGRGHVYLDMQDYVHALADFTKAIELHKNGYNYHMRGTVYRDMQDHAHALADFTKAIELQPKNGDNYYWRGYVYRDMQDYAHALADLTQAIELQPKDGYNYYWRGRVYRDMQDYHHALADLTQAIELQPKNGDNYHWRGHVYRDMQDYPHALADLTQAIELQPKDSDNYYWRGRVYRDMQDYPHALVDLTKAIELDEKKARNVGQRGTIYRLMKNYSAALENFNRAIELDNVEGWWYYQRALAQLLQLQHVQVEADLQQAIALADKKHQAEPQNWSVTFELGLYYLATDHQETAEQLYESGLTAPAVYLHTAIHHLNDFLIVQPEHERALAMFDHLKSIFSERLSSLT